MNYDEIRKLLGGYATGTLTPEENQRLMSAAIEDQRIFDALADEEALRELLDDPAFRQELLVELRETPAGLQERIVSWWRRPLPLAFAGGVAAVVLAVLVLAPMRQPEAPTEVAMVRKVGQESRAELEEALPSMDVQEAAQAKTEEDAVAPVFGDRLKKEKSVPPMAVGSAGGGSAVPSASPRPESALLERKDDQDLRSEPKKRAVVQRVGTAAEAFERRQNEVVREVNEEAAPMGAMAYRSRAQSALRDESAGRTAAVPQVRAERLAADGVWVTVESGGAVKLSDTVRVEVVAPTDGHAYVLISDGAEQARLAAEARVPGGRPVYVPADGGLPSPAEAVERRITVMFTPEELADDAVRERAARTGARVVNTVVRYE